MTREEAIEVMKSWAWMQGETGKKDATVHWESTLDDVEEALEMAIAALREREEQSKGCSACDGGFGDNTMVFYAGGYKHCPICGRRLEDV